jgi:group II intron reverse transcriptase/maturase
MHDDGKSDKLIVPKNPANKEGGRPPSAERAEGRGLAKGNPGEQTRFWTQGQVDLHDALDRIRKAARKDRKTRFTALWHHVYNVPRLRKAYSELRPDAAPGVDGETWDAYGKDLDARLKDLSERLQRGAYRAKPVKRVYIPKADGKQRPLGIPALEDKIVQRATTEVLEAIYETDFKGFSYGFRRGRSQHDALDALSVAIEHRRVNWVLDADIQGFFDTLDHEWLMKFVEHRVADRRVVRHIKKWLNAGVLEQGQLTQAQEGTPQGGSISPLLANIYLHYVLDLWADWWRKHHAKGEVIIVRYADDFVVGFQHEEDGRRFLEQLRERMARFNLRLHPDKTRLIEFGRFADTNRKGRGQGKPETFGFLGFTHICSKTRRGRFCVLRKTIAKRLRAKLQQVKADLWRRMHHCIAQTGQWLKAVIEGHYRYYGVPRNIRSLTAFQRAITRLWLRVLRRRSAKSSVTWERMERLVRRWLPAPRIYHPYPDQRFRVRTQGRSPVR